MSSLKLLLPSSITLDTSLLEGFAVTLHGYNDKEPTIPDEHIDAEILVTHDNIPENLADAVRRMSRLRWIQTLSSGSDVVSAAGFPASVAVTNGRGLHDHSVSEHTLGLLLCAVRRLHEMRDCQFRSTWASHLDGRPSGHLTTLRGAHVLVWGFGSIGQTLATHLGALGAHVRGVARSAGIRNGVEVFTQDALPQLLPRTDALVMILPGSSATRHALNADRIALLPRHSWVVNVGRGIAIDQEALADALAGGAIGGAALDVFETEPLPADSRLWKMANVIVSPHVAGWALGSEALIAANLRRFLAGQPLTNVAERG